MSQNKTNPDRFVGLDVHKHYLIAAAVDADRQEAAATGPRRVPLVLTGHLGAENPHASRCGGL